MLLASYQTTRFHSKDHNKYNMDFDSVRLNIDEEKKNDGALGRCKKNMLQST
jgi:hypothetical protein